MGPTAKDTGSYETHGGGKRHRGEGHVEPEAETRVTQPQPRTPAATRSWRRWETDSPRASPEGAWPCQHLGFRLLVSKAMRIVSCGFEPHVWG